LCSLEHKTESCAAEPDWYQDFLSPPHRADLLGTLSSEMDDLRAAYDIVFGPPRGHEHFDRNRGPYAGLTPARLEEIKRDYDRVCGRVGFRVERRAIRLAGDVRTRGVGSALLSVLRILGAKRAWKRFVRRLQLGKAS
jgi:hypothetical protein